MKALTPVMLLAGMLAVPSSGWADAVRGQTVGKAYDLESDELLYRETHCVSIDDSKREVIYQDGSGDMIAHKRVDYRSGETTPSFVQENYYSRERIEVELGEGRVLMAVRDTADPDSASVSSNSFAGDIPLVIDAGFDAFVRQNWDALVSGETREFLFPFAGRSSLIELRMRPAQCSYDTETDQCFRLELSNWFFRMLADPIELGYDASERRLTRYRGLSNIGDGEGNGLVVDIRYDYDNVPEQACTLPRPILTDNADFTEIAPHPGDRKS